MRFPLDVLFIDGGGRVIRVLDSIRPWRASMPVRGAKAAIELPAGTARRRRAFAGSGGARGGRRRLPTSRRRDRAPYDVRVIATRGYAAAGPTSPLGPFDFERRDLRPNDVLIDILFCGVCHSDIHQARDEWGGSIFPMVPGHEIVGTVVEVGGAGDPLADRRHGRGRRVRRLVPRVRSVPRRRGAVLRARHDRHLQRSRARWRRRRRTAGTPSTSWWTRTTSCGSPTASRSTAPRRCSAPASPRTHRSGTSAAARQARPPSSGSAASATWASSSSRPWARG